MQSVSVSPDTTHIITLNQALWGQKQQVQIWNRQGILLGSVLVDESNEVTIRSASFSADGNRFYTQSYDMRLPFATANSYIPTNNTLRLYDLKTRKQHTILKTNKTIQSMDVSPDGNRIVTAGEDQTARIWNRAGELLATLPHEDVVSSARFSPDGQRLVTTVGNKAMLWYTAEGALAWLRENQNKVAPLSKENKVKYGIESR